MKSEKENPVPRLIATGLIVLLMTGCAKQMPDTGAFTGTLENEITHETIVVKPSLDDTGLLPEESKSEEPKSKLDEYIGYLSGQEIISNIDEILNDPYEYSEKEQEIAAYQNLKRHNLSITDIADELHNILVVTCTTDGHSDIGSYSFEVTTYVDDNGKINTGTKKITSPGTINAIYNSH